MNRALLRSLASALLLIAGGDLASAAPLRLEVRIPLGEIQGRIDHMAVDLGRNRLYIAELGNNSVGVVDLKAHRTVRTLGGFREPQGIAYVPSSDTLYVTSGGDGSLRLFQAGDLTPLVTIAVGDDADNIRVDDAAHRVYVGYGDGALAVIDTTTHRKVADIPLKAHPESFQLEPAGQHIYVNVPDARAVAVVDRATGKQAASWPTRSLRENFPLALDAARQRVLAVFREPAKLAAFHAPDGRLLLTLDTCRDADDVFVDTRRDRLYISCGEGFIDVLAARDQGYESVARIPTVAGARTALFVPEIDRLILAVRASASVPASVWVFRPESLATGRWRAPPNYRRHQ